MPNLIGLVPESSASADGPKYDEDAIIIGDDSDIVIAEEENEDKEDKEIKPVKKDEEQEESDSDPEEEEEEPLKIAFDRPSIRDINAKYPDFFKDFPELKDAIFREARFTSFFPTVEDAKEAFDDNEAFTVLSDSALSGDSAPLIESIFTTDKKAAIAFSATFLPNLYKKDQEAYSIAVTPLFENFLRQAYGSADENMKNSALNLAQFLFGNEGEDSVTGKKTLSKTVQLTEESKQAAKAKDESSSKLFRESAAAVSQIVEKNMFALVSKDFDPEKVFTPTIRKMLITDIVSQIDKQLTYDKGHVAVMGARWKRARNSGYQEADKSKLISAYLARAKQLIPSVREKVRLAALGKSSNAGKSGGLVSSARANGQQRVQSEVNGRTRVAEKTKDYSKMTDREILDS